MAVVTSQAHDNPLVGFGPNEWIVEDMYQRYLADPASVDPAWHDFFADYRPDGTGTETAAPAAKPAAGTAAPTAAPAAPTPAPAPAAAPVPAAAKAAPAPAPAIPSAPPSAPAPSPAAPGGTTTQPIRGVAAKIVSNMDASLQVPTATSVRAVPAKLLSDNRIVINNHLARGRGGKVSFTHLIGYALVRAVAAHR